MSTVEFDVTEGIATITISRPSVMNALDSATRERMIEQLRDYREDDAVDVVVLRGAGEHFCAGGDLDEFRDLETKSYGLKYLIDSWSELYDAMVNLQKPTVAAVDGYALGGGLNTLLYTDVVVASEDAVFGTPEVELGFLDPFGVAHLTHLAGTHRTLDMMMTGRDVSAAEAERFGLVSRLVPPADLDAAVARVADSLAGMSSAVLARLKETVYASAQMSPEAAVTYARRAQVDDALANPDFEEGIEAFLERREPDWST